MFHTFNCRVIWLFKQYDFFSLYLCFYFYLYNGSNGPCCVNTLFKYVVLGSKGILIQQRCFGYCTLPSIITSLTEFDLGWLSLLMTSIQVWFCRSQELSDTRSTIATNFWPKITTCIIVSPLPLSCMYWCTVFYIEI